MSAPPSSPSSPAPRAGRCAIVGRPNVGKSTLLNALLGHKLVIATAVPGTTRASVLGVYVSEEPPTQIAFVDTPGLHRPKSALGKVLVEEAKAGLGGADVVVFVTEARKKPADALHAEDERVLRLAIGAGRPIIAAVNKVDRLADKQALLPQLAQLSERHDFAALVPISATARIQLDALLSEIRDRLPEGVLYPDADVLTDRPARFFAAELVREAILRRTRAEIPHGVAVVIERFEQTEGLTRIHATIVVEKASHKGIVIGARGALLKEIGTEARQEIQRFLDAKVHLELWVKVVEGWTGHAVKARRLVSEGST